MPTAKLYKITMTTDTGRTVSRREYGDALGILIQAPASLEGGITRTIEVSADGVTFATLVNADGNVALPAAGEAGMYLDMIAATAWRIAYSAAPASSEEWLLSKNWEN